MNQTCADSVERSRAYYEAKFLQFHENKEEAIEQTLHLFLNENPSTSAENDEQYGNNQELVLAWVRKQTCCPSCLKTLRLSKLKKALSAGTRS